MSPLGVAGLGGGAIPVLVDRGLPGPTQHKAAGLLLPRASHQPWTTKTDLSSRTGQNQNRDLDADQAKEGEINSKSHISLTSPTPTSMKGLSLIGSLLPGFALMSV